MFIQGIFTGVIKEFEMIDLEEKEVALMEDKYWQTTSYHSYYQEINAFEVETTDGDEISKCIGNKAKD